MVEREYLTPDEKAVIIGMHRMGNSIKEISIILEIPEIIVMETIDEYFKKKK